jgi:excisionase family DNA binding protein
VSEEITFTVSSKTVDRLAERLAEELATRLPASPAPYLNVDQAAEYLACHKRRIYDLVERRAFSSFRDGRRLLLRRSDLDAYVAERRE